MLVDSTDICRSIPAVGRPLRFPIDIIIAKLPSSINNAARTTVQYLQNIISDSQFARDLVMWLTNNRWEWRREHLNTSRYIIHYEVLDMVMAML